MKNNQPDFKEKRKYIRLDSVFPVEFQIVKPLHGEPLGSWHQGFTNNISKGGICLTINNLSDSAVSSINDPSVRLKLNINVSGLNKPVSALARVAWIKKTKESEPNQYLLGLAYDEIKDSENKKIVAFARAKMILPIVSAALILVLAGFFIANSLYDAKLHRENRALIDNLVATLQKSSNAREAVIKIQNEEKELQERLSRYDSVIRSLNEKLFEAQNSESRINKERQEDTARSQELLTEIESLNKEIGTIKAEKDAFQNNLNNLNAKEELTQRELVSIEQTKEDLQSASVKNMYKWLKIHQNPRTGLVSSFEGDKDLNDYAFIYDESLCALSYTIFSDYDRAKKVFDFFLKKAKRYHKVFYNAYYASAGEPAEYIVHAGPNLWLGISIAQYTKKTKDKTYLCMAEDIAEWVINLQNEDPQKGLRGGPTVTWYSTEHNLDGYAFLNMMYKLTGKPNYKTASENILNWLNKNAYGRTDIPIKRGKGDSTIATDTYAWSIAAIGPEKLKSLGMDPDDIMDFAEKNCLVRTKYIRQSGEEINVKGFDFAPARHVARGGVISCEWTAQMIMSFKILSDYYKNKDQNKYTLYKTKAEDYMTELGKLVICSPSPTGQGQGCLPYATQDFVDTGHGWMTPKGTSTGSVAATAYTLFSYLDFNPLEFKD